MNLNKKDKDQLIRYRLEQAFQTIEVAELLINNKSYPAAVNRIYYGIFYALLALGMKYDFETSKHHQLIGWFNKNFINTGIIEIEFGKILRLAFESRTSGDYDVFREFKEEAVWELLQNMKKFINKISDFLKE